MKLLAALLAPILLLIAGVLLFRGDVIRWLPPVQSLVAILAAAPAAFAWTYFAEDRQRRFMLKALSKVVSPAVAHQLAADPQRLALGTVRTDITVLFTDLANFTDLSEALDPHQLESLLNRYLGEMSNQVLAQDGTLDKYIGDAVMCFWNAPLPQKEHAILACHAALAMIRREKELHEEFARLLGTKHIFTRIGINTATVAVGFIGSDHTISLTTLPSAMASIWPAGSKGRTNSTAPAFSSPKSPRSLSNLISICGKSICSGSKAKSRRWRSTNSGPIGRWIIPQHHQELAMLYEKAFELYRQRKWEEAAAGFLELSRVFGEDGPTAAMLARIEGYRRTPPDEGWDGVYDSKEK